MKKFKINHRVGYQEVTFIVIADNKNEAMDKTIDQLRDTGSLDFTNEIIIKEVV